MPIKLPKGFQRRKSSGNVLDDIPTTEESSFRVIPRPGSSGAALEPPKFPQNDYRNSFDEDGEDLFTVARPDATNRGSGGTNNSTSTAPYDSAASSRISTSSTNPSSVDTKSDHNVRGGVAAAYADIPIPPTPGQRGGFLRNAGRNFSIAKSRKSQEVNDLPPPANKTPASSVRDRSMTVSSVTTATPPRLDDTNISINNSELDGFGNMFDSIGTKSSRDVSPSRQYQQAPQPRSGLLRSSRQGAVPVLTTHGDQFDSSPYSFASQNSRDGLMRSPSPSRTVTQASPQVSTVKPTSIQATTSLLSRTESSEDDNIFADPQHHRGDNRSPSMRSPPSSFPSMAMRARGYSGTTSTIRNPISERSSLEAPGTDPGLLANAEIANRYQTARVTPAASAGKVMTPAQFERYRQQKEETRRYNKVFGKEESDDSGDDYEDDEEDEQEREREKAAVKQRKKQEAHLAVYRQQMMKVTGERPASQNEERPSSSHSNPVALANTLEIPSNSSRPLSGMDISPNTPRFSTTLETPASPPRRSSTFDVPINTGRNSSMLDIPSMTNRMSQMTVDGKRSSSGGKSSQGDDEDEDIPLGILAAHGFPGKNRPPSKLMATSSNPNLRASAQMDATQQPGNRESRLPAFARHLPQDPYYGASIAQPAYRESLAFNRESLAMQSTPNLMAPQAPGAATAHPLHPSGLVGVIAGEERARAMRRGSPNTQGAYELPQMPPPNPGMPGMQRAHTMGNMNGMGMPGMMMPGMPGMMSPNDQAQLQMSQQMNQMMQLQMQWMQYMTQAMGQNASGGISPEAMSPQGMMQPPMQPGMPPMNRPQSVPLQQFPAQGQRTMSMVNPNLANWTHSSPAVPQLSQAMNGQYAPSIAPSERSNIGMASRYRPVSIMQQEPEPQWQKRSSTFTSSTLRPWSHADHNSKAPAKSTIRPVSTIVDDEDDEQGWAEMAAKKEQKKRKWKLRKTQTDTTLQELYNA